MNQFAGEKDSCRAYLDEFSWGQVDVKTHFLPLDEKGEPVCYVDPYPVSYYKIKTDDNPNGYTDENIDSLALCSISGGATFRNIPNGKYIDVVTGDAINVTNSTLSVSSISKGNLRVYVRDNGATKNLGKIGNTTTYLK
jgi:hypothetical protein